MSRQYTSLHLLAALAMVLVLGCPGKIPTPDNKCQWPASCKK